MKEETFANFIAIMAIIIALIILGLFTISQTKEKSEYEKLIMETTETN